MKPHEEAAAKELLDKLRKSNPELARQSGIRNGSPDASFCPYCGKPTIPDESCPCLSEWDETAECHHGVQFCDPCEDCEDES